MTSITLTLSGNSSNLRAEYFPAIDLSGGSYVCGLIDFQTFNSIPNVDETNNMFYYGNEKEIKTVNHNIETNEIIKNVHPDDTASGKNGIKNKKTPSIKKLQPMNFFRIPVGSYEVKDLEAYIKKQLELQKVEFALAANKNTLQCEILCSQPIDFSKPNTIGPLLGFKAKHVLKRNKTHISRHPASILKLNVIRVECNIIKGAFLNNKPVHTIHEFSPKVPPGYKIIETPQNVIYFPVTVKSIHDLNLSIVDQDNKLINFRGETITIRLHLKKVQ